MMRTWAWVSVAIGVALLAGACGGSGGGDVGLDDLPIRVDAGGDGARDAGADTTDTADIVAVDPGPPPDGEAGEDPGGATDADAGVDPGAPPDDGVAVDPGVDPGPPACVVGRDLCFNAANDGNTAATAKVIGRIWGALNKPFTANPDTRLTDDEDNLDDGCWDGGNDVFYRIYLRAGELLNVQMLQAPEIRMVLKAYRGTAGASDPSSLVTCADTTTTCGEYRCGNLQLNADVEGWYTIVLDGETYEDQGQHRLDFYLMNCAEVNCCCPY